MKYLQIIILPIALSVFSSVVHAQNTTDIEKKKFVSGVWEDEGGYTGAIKSGNTIHVSGIPAKGPMDEAIKKIYGQLEKILTSYGVTFQNVVKETVYTTNIEELIKHKDLKKSFYKGDYPASTWVEISRLYSPQAILEIEFIVLIDEK
jgi:2-iminobutanoate/2-iminopropanoate deaminase